MKKHEVKALADQLAEAATRHGGSAAVTYDPTWREHLVEVRFPDVKATIHLDRNTGNADSALGDVLVSWHGATRDLNPYAFQDVNRCHYRKASDVAPVAGAVAMMGRRCAAIAIGSAFRAS